MQDRGVRQVRRQGEHGRMLRALTRAQDREGRLEKPQWGKSTAIATAIVTMLKIVLAVTIDPVVPESSL